MLYSIAMKSSRSSNTGEIMDSACSELINAIISQPGRSLRISEYDIEAAAGSLYWPDIDHCRSFSPNASTETLSNQDLAAMCMEPLSCAKKPMSLSVLTFSGSEWKSNHTADRREERSDIPDMDSLPDGLREFINQLILVYSLAESASKDSKISREEAVEAVSTSEHLVVVFPLIIRFVVREIRTRSRSCDANISDLLSLLEAIVSNPKYLLSYQGEFEIVLGCLLDLVMDPNMMRNDDNEEMKQSIRRRAVAIISSFLREKMGIFHSIKLVGDVIDNVLIPYIEKISSGSMATPLVWSGVTGAVQAVDILAKEFLPNRPSLKIEKLFTKRLLARGDSVSPVCARVIKQCVKHLV